MIQLAPQHRRIIIRVLKLTLTFGLMGIIVSQMNWRDRILLHDGTQAIVTTDDDDVVCARLPSSNEIVRFNPGDYARLVPGVPTLVKSIQPFWFALAFALHIGTQCILAVRWSVLLSTESRRVPLATTLIWLLRSQALATLPIGPIGLEAIRVHQSRKKAGGVSQAIGILIVERMLGLPVLCTLAGVGLYYLPQARGVIRLNPEALRPAALLLLLLIPLCIWLMFIVSSRYPSNRLARVIRRFAEEARLCWSRFYCHPRQIAIALAITFALHLSAVSTYVAAAQGLGLGGGWSLYLVVVTAMNFIRCIPSFGVGEVILFEGSMTVMLSTLGNLSANEAVALCAIIRVIGLLYRPIPVVALWLRPEPSYVPADGKPISGPETEGGLADVACA